MHLARQRAAQLDREVQPRRLGPAVVQVVAVFDDVDAADEGRALVHDTQFLMQPAQLPGLQPGPPAVERAEHLQPHAAAGQPRTQRGQRRQRAEAVDDQVHLHAAAVGVEQRVGDAAAGAVVVEDVGRQPDLAPRRGDGFAHAREQLVAALQQVDSVGADEARCRHTQTGPQGCIPRMHRAPLQHQAGSSSATSGRWSDMRAQAMPRGTIIVLHRRPRR